MFVFRIAEFVMWLLSAVEFIFKQKKHDKGIVLSFENVAMRQKAVLAGSLKNILPLLSSCNKKKKEAILLQWRLLHGGMYNLNFMIYSGGARLD